MVNQAEQLKLRRSHNLSESFLSTQTSPSPTKNWVRLMALRECIGKPQPKCGNIEKEEAFNWLEKEISECSPNASNYAIDPELDDLRTDPRFKEMLKRLNLPE
jgi:hypothetical protein